MSAINYKEEIVTVFMDETDPITPVMPLGTFTKKTVHDDLSVALLKSPHMELNKWPPTNTDPTKTKSIERVINGLKWDNHELAALKQLDYLTGSLEMMLGDRKKGVQIASAWTKVGFSNKQFDEAWHICAICNNCYCSGELLTLHKSNPDCLNRHANASQFFNTVYVCRVCDEPWIDLDLAIAHVLDEFNLAGYNFAAKGLDLSGCFTRIRVQQMHSPNTDDTLRGLLKGSNVDKLQGEMDFMDLVDTLFQEVTEDDDDHEASPPTEDDITYVGASSNNWMVSTKASKFGHIRVQKPSTKSDNEKPVHSNKALQETYRKKPPSYEQNVVYIKKKEDIQTPENVTVVIATNDSLVSTINPVETGNQDGNSDSDNLDVVCDDNNRENKASNAKSSVTTEQEITSSKPHECERKRKIKDVKEPKNTKKLKKAVVKEPLEKAKMQKVCKNAAVIKDTDDAIWEKTDDNRYTKRTRVPKKKFDIEDSFSDSEVARLLDQRRKTEFDEQKAEDTNEIIQSIFNNCKIAISEEEVNVDVVDRSWPPSKLNMAFVKDTSVDMILNGRKGVRTEKEKLRRQTEIKEFLTLRKSIRACALSNMSLDTKIGVIMAATDTAHALTYNSNSFQKHLHTEKARQVQLTKQLRELSKEIIEMVNS